MYQSLVRNADGEPIGMEYVRDAYEEEISQCEEMDFLAENPAYAAQLEAQRWYDTACEIFKERGIRVPDSVIETLGRELRKKQIEAREEEALKEAQPCVDFLNNRFPECDAEAYYYPETCDEIEQVEIHINGKKPPIDEMRLAFKEAGENGLCIGVYISLRWY